MFRRSFLSSLFAMIGLKRQGKYPKGMTHLSADETARLRALVDNYDRLAVAYADDLEAVGKHWFGDLSGPKTEARKAAIADANDKLTDALTALPGPGEHIRLTNTIRQLPVWLLDQGATVLIDRAHGVAYLRLNTDVIERVDIVSIVVL